MHVVNNDQAKFSALTLKILFMPAGASCNLRHRQTRRRIDMKRAFALGSCSFDNALRLRIIKRAICADMSVIGGGF
jgi:hypothetical protein